MVCVFISDVNVLTCGSKRRWLQTTVNKVGSKSLNYSELQGLY